MQPWLFIVIWLICFLFAFVHIFLVAMDGWSRFQNYKRAKDQFYIHGFNRRIANTYIGSKCQRNAAIVAAEELGIGEKVKDYYVTKGVKWHHFVPYYMVKNPLFFFSDIFWSRSFLEKNYKPKFNYSNLQIRITIAIMIISGHDLSKSYGKLKVLDNVNISCAAGEICGLLGANGAGKNHPF